MSYPHRPYEIHLYDAEGYIECVDSFRTPNEAVKTIHSLIAEAQKDLEGYAGCHYLLVCHEVDGMTEWHEPIEKFVIIA
jgi:hypothetical protein